MLKANKARSKWLVLYNSATPSEGRKRFTIAHEFGHYILHRHQQDLFECGDDDIETGDNNERDIEAEADLFASTLLMPLDDFRRQVDGQPISFDLLGHCADRYGVSLTAAALRWTARPVDVDIALIERETILEPDLVVPHALLAERSFVLVPLAEIAGETVHPLLGHTIAELRGARPDTERAEVVRVAGPEWAEGAGR